MKKQEFLDELKEKLKGMPESDVRGLINFYEEAINDRMGEGKSEEEAVKAIGTVDEVVSQIAKETPIFTLVKEKVIPNRKLSITEIVLLVVGFPLWFPLLLTFLILLLVFYLVLWIIGSVPAITCVGAFAYGIFSFLAFFGYAFDGEFVLSCIGLFLAGIGLGSILIPASIYSIKWMVKLTQLMYIKTKKSFMSKRRAK